MQRRVVAVAVGGFVGLAGAIWSSGLAAGAIPFFPAPASVLRTGLMANLGTTARTGRPDLERLHRDAVGLSRRAPLDDAPFLIEGAVREHAGEGAKADALYWRAVRRNPRSTGAHFLLANRALAENDVETSLQHLASMARQSQAAQAEFNKVMLEIATARRYDRAVRRYVAREPVGREQLFAALSASPERASRLFELAPSRPQGPPPAWLATLIDTEVRSGRPARAALAWTRYGGGADPRRQSLRDPTFRASSISPPFGWRLTESEGAVAARDAGGLAVENYGRDTSLIAEQWMMLSPGRYAVRTRSSGELAPQLEWQVHCLMPARRLARLPLDRAAAVDVPGDCAVQSLQMWTRSVEGAGLSSGIVGSVEVRRLP